MATDLTELEEYCKYMLSIGRKKRTIETYSSQIRKCLVLLNAYKRPYKCADIRPEDIYFLKDHLPVKEQTAHVQIKRLDAMIVWKTHKSLTESMNILWNRVIRERVFITAEEYKRMYRHADIPQRMVLVLGAMMGLRRQEIATITLDDIGENDILIHGKGHGEQGLVTRQPMPKEVKDELTRYKAWRDRNYHGTSRVLIFMTTRSGAISKRKNQMGRISESMTELAEKVGIEGASTHTLRRLFGTTAYAVSGHNLVTTQRLLRHASSNTTVMCYIDADTTDQKQTVSEIGNVLATD